MAFRIHRNKELLEREIENGCALIEAATAGDSQRLEELLDHGVAVNAEAYNRNLFYSSQNYMTPLQVAAVHGHSECVRLLIDRGGVYSLVD